MAEVPCVQGGILLMELTSQCDIIFFQRPHFRAGSEDKRHRLIQRLKPPGRQIYMNHLLQDLRGCIQRSPVQS